MLLCVLVSVVTDHFPIHVQTVRDSGDHTGATDLFPPVARDHFTSTPAFFTTNLWLFMKFKLTHIRSLKPQHINMTGILLLSSLEL